MRRNKKQSINDLQQVSMFNLNKNYMATRPKLPEAETLEQYRVALENAKQQPTIASLIAEFGYGPEKIAEGEELLSETNDAYETNKTEDDETAESYGKWLDLKNTLADCYAMDRKKAKVAFAEDALTREKLGVSGAMPQAYVKWLENIKKFYKETLADTTIQNELSAFKISANYLAETQSIIKDLEEARTDYLREKGESQDATKTKDAAFKKMDDWMSRFYAVSKIALEDNPQLLEAMGKFIRS